MSLNINYLSGLCPYCESALDYEKDETSVACHSCRRAIATRMLLPLRAIRSDKQRDIGGIASTDGAASAKSALIYFNNFLESFDWKRFAMTPELTISEMDQLAASTRIRFSDDPITYVLDFRRTAIPMFKKMESLGVLEGEIMENYKKDDISDLFEFVDLYSSITTGIVSLRDELLSTLENDLRLAKKFGADEALVSDLERSLELFRESVSAIVAASDIESIPGYIRAKELCDARLAEKLESGGIDAERTYQKASLMMSEGQVDGALHLYHLLGDYKDSAKIIRRHSTFFEFRDLFEAAGKRYTVKDKRPLYFSVDGEAAAETGYTYSLVDAQTQYPAMSEVSRVIACWGTRIFFIRNDESICCFDTREKELYANVRIIDEGLRGDYAVDERHPIRFSSDRSQFFVRKIIHTAKKRKKRKKHINRDNNYSIIRVDMDEMTCKTVIPEVVDIMDFCDDKLFYTAVDKEGSATFRVWSLAEERDEEVLGTECVIHKVLDKRIIYSVWAPSKYNLNLYSVDIEEKQPTLLASNISSYYTSYEGKIFYTVGTEGAARLYSVTPDGKERCEISATVGSISELRSGWIYFVSGDDRNAALMKVSTDGERTVTVATRFKRLIKMTNGYVYYLSTAGDLCVARSDGNERRVIAESVADEQIIIDDNGIYYLRREFVGNEYGDGDGMGCSLYATDLDGKGLTKIAHNVTDMKDYSDDEIQITSKSVNDYMITTPVSKKKTRTDYVTRTVTYYELLNKKSGERRVIMEVGAPERSYGSYKTGCIFARRRKRVAATIENVTVRRGYEREGVTERGYIREGEIREMNRKKDERAERKREKKEAKIAAKEARISARKHAKAAKKEGKATKSDTGTDS